MNNNIEISLDNKKLSIETGTLAKQATGSVLVKSGGTTVLIAVVLGKEVSPEEQKNPEGMVPLLVDYRERTYATGKIPGGFFKREGRPRDREITTSRLVDRCVRPLFPHCFPYNMQISNLVLSCDAENDADIPAIIGTSCALLISGIPFNGPISAVRVARINNNFVLNPSFAEQDQSDIDMVVTSCKDNEITMLEFTGNQVDEKTIISAIEFAIPNLIKLNQLQIQFMNQVQKKDTIKLCELDIKPELYAAVKELANEKIAQIFVIYNKTERAKAINEMKKYVSEQLKDKYAEIDIKYVLEKLFQSEIRSLIVNTKKRPDGRGYDEIRSISCAVNVLPRTHGSALFTRGETQALVTVTLGSPQDMQVMEELEGEYKERFLFHYNFPGFATNEVRPDRSPSRREVGHGSLAKKSIYPLLPKEDEFLYTIRLVSDILESNGSSSMASVCGGSLALFDAGVPIVSSVAGVAMGLITTEKGNAILTDIAGLEDHLGDMDFKVAGTKTGITGLQLDLKLTSIDLGTLKEALVKANTARNEILNKMNEAINQPRKSISEYAPKMVIIQIPKDKIGGLIGPGGKNIRQILEETGTEINIEDDGKVFISGVETEKIELAKKKIGYYTAEVEIGKIYSGKVVKIMDFGAFVEILPGKEGLVHISKLAPYRVNKVTDIVKEGDVISVKVLNLDEQNRLVLSRKDALSATGSSGNKQQNENGQ